MPKERILVVDDEYLIRWSLQQDLAKEGYEVLVAESGEEALKIVRGSPPDLVLLEVLMDDGAGWKLLEEVRALGGAAGEGPVVVLTRGERSPRLYGRAVELAAYDFLCKPALRSELLAAVLECEERAPPS